MKRKELRQLKERYFQRFHKSWDILRFYKLPPEVIAAEEERLAQEKRKAKEAKARLLPTRGEVSLRRRTRRSVGIGGS